jgi:hypothetical protein
LERLYNNLQNYTRKELKEMFRKTKELQSLVNASRKNLKDAERKVEDRNILIADLQKKNEELTNENLAVHEENKDLRFENDEQKELIDRITDDLKLIETQEHKAEILVEYKQTLNVSQAITSVTNRFKVVEEEKKKIEQEKELQEFVVDTAKESDKYIEQTVLNAPAIEEKQEEILTLKFTVKGTRTKLRELKQFLENGGYDYE